MLHKLSAQEILKEYDESVEVIINTDRGSIFSIGHSEH